MEFIWFQRYGLGGKVGKKMKWVVNFLSKLESVEFFSKWLKAFLPWVGLWCSIIYPIFLILNGSPQIHQDFFFFFLLYYKFYKPMKQDWKTIKALSCESSALPTHQRFHHLAAYQIPTRIGLKKKKKILRSNAMHVRTGMKLASKIFESDKATMEIWKMFYIVLVIIIKSLHTEEYRPMDQSEIVMYTF